MFDMLSPAGLPKLTLLSRIRTHTHIQREAAQKTERTRTCTQVVKQHVGIWYLLKQEATD